MADMGEGVAVTPIEDLEERHWATVEYTYANGLPVTGTFRAVDACGMPWTGTLNDSGQANLNGLPPGTTSFELMPGDHDAELEDLRKAIKDILDAIIEAEKAEAAEVSAKYGAMSDVVPGSGGVAAVATGFWNGAVGLLSFAWDVAVTAAEVANYLNPIEKLNNLVTAAYKSYQDGELTEEEWLESLFDNYKEEEFSDLAELLGFDIRELDREKLKRSSVLLLKLTRLLHTSTMTQILWRSLSNLQKTMPAFSRVTNGQSSLAEAYLKLC